VAFKKASSKLPVQLTRSTLLRPEALLTVRLKQESDQPPLQIYGPAIYKLVLK
jgi:hypothetical protein